MQTNQRRAGRIAFGTTLIIGAVALAIDGLLSLRGGLMSPKGSGAVPAYLIVVTTWAVAVALFAVRSTSVETPKPQVDDERQRLRSLTRPAIGLALMLPLTLHMPIAIALGGSRAFDVWCGLSVIFVGIAHLVFASLLVGRMKAILGGRKPRTSTWIYVITVLASVVPGIVVPPVIVALTAMPLFAIVIPELDRIAQAELAPDAADMPRAIVVTRRAG